MFKLSVVCGVVLSVLGGCDDKAPTLDSEQQAASAWGSANAIEYQYTPVNASRGPLTSTNVQGALDQAAAIANGAYSHADFWISHVRTSTEQQLDQLRGYTDQQLAWERMNRERSDSEVLDQANELVAQEAIARAAADEQNLISVSSSIASEAAMRQDGDAATLASATQYSDQRFAESTSALAAALSAESSARSQQIASAAADARAYTDSKALTSIDQLEGLRCTPETSVHVTMGGDSGRQVILECISDAADLTFGRLAQQPYSCAGGPEAQQVHQFTNEGRGSFTLNTYAIEPAAGSENVFRLLDTSGCTTLTGLGAQCQITVGVTAYAAGAQYRAVLVVNGTKRFSLAAVGWSGSPCP